MLGFVQTGSNPDSQHPFIVRFNYNREKVMGEWNENIESWLDKAVSIAKTLAVILVVISLLCIVGTMDWNDQISASAMLALFHKPEPDCEIRSAEHGRASVKVCGAKGKPLTKMIND